MTGLRGQEAFDAVLGQPGGSTAGGRAPMDVDVQPIDLAETEDEDEGRHSPPPKRRRVGPAPSTTTTSTTTTTTTTTARPAASARPSRSASGVRPAWQEEEGKAIVKEDAEALQQQGDADLARQMASQPDTPPAARSTPSPPPGTQAASSQPDSAPAARSTPTPSVATQAESSPTASIASSRAPRGATPTSMPPDARSTASTEATRQDSARAPSATAPDFEHAPKSSRSREAAPPPPDRARSRSREGVDAGRRRERRKQRRGRSRDPSRSRSRERDRQRERERQRERDRQRERRDNRRPFPVWRPPPPPRHAHRYAPPRGFGTRPRFPSPVHHRSKSPYRRRKRDDGSRPRANRSRETCKQDDRGVRRKHDDDDPDKGGGHHDQHSTSSRRAPTSSGSSHASGTGRRKTSSSGGHGSGGKGRGRHRACPTLAFAANDHELHSRTTTVQVVHHPPRNFLSQTSTCMRLSAPSAATTQEAASTPGETESAARPKVGLRQPVTTAGRAALQRMLRVDASTPPDVRSWARTASFVGTTRRGALIALAKDVCELSRNMYRKEITDAFVDLFILAPMSKAARQERRDLEFFLFEAAVLCLPPEGVPLPSATLLRGRRVRVFADGRSPHVDAQTSHPVVSRLTEFAFLRDAVQLANSCGSPPPPPGQGEHSARGAVTYGLNVTSLTVMRIVDTRTAAPYPWKEGAGDFLLLDVSLADGDEQPTRHGRPHRHIVDPLECASDVRAVCLRVLLARHSMFREAGNPSDEYAAHLFQFALGRDGEHSRVQQLYAEDEDRPEERYSSWRQFRRAFGRLVGGVAERLDLGGKETPRRRPQRTEGRPSGLALHRAVDRHHFERMTDRCQVLARREAKQRLGRLPHYMNVFGSAVLDLTSD